MARLLKVDGNNVEESDSENKVYINVTGNICIRINGGNDPCYLEMSPFEAKQLAEELEEEVGEYAIKLTAVHISGS